jgi:threonine aldolase
MIVNLISDTVTKPSKDMLAYMIAQDVGDDVFGEDPTINALEDKIAKMFGHEAAIFCPSGTMTNQIAIKMHTNPLDEVICDHYSHIYQYEVGGYAYHSGVAINPIQGSYGKLTATQIEQNIKPQYDWLPRTKLVVLENSTNKGGGNYYTIEEIKEINAICKKHHLALHLDGARIFNVLVETGESTLDVGNYFDSISICLSKGLGAPVGSLLISSKEKVAQARRIRKVMGGGMRQAGLLAAAGIFALENHIPDLKIDNDRAKEIASLLSQCHFIDSVLPTKTNIIIALVKTPFTADQILAKFAEMGVKLVNFGGNTIRLVFHRDITEDAYEYLKTICIKLTQKVQ